MARLALSFKGHLLGVYPMGNETLVIGRDPGCGIHIDSLAVEPCHARISTEEGVAILRPERASALVFVNHRMTQEHRLRDGDVIRIGKHTLTYSQDPVPDEAAAASPPTSVAAQAAPVGWLQLLSGHHVGRTVRLDRPLLRLGRPGTQTALIAQRDGAYFLSPLEGQDLPTVGGAPLGEQSRRLQDGDIIEVGEVRVQFFLESPQ